MPTYRDSRLPEEGSQLIQALETLGHSLEGGGVADPEAARRALDDVRRLLHSTGNTDSVADTYVKETDAVLSADDELGRVDVLQRRQNVARKLLAWAEALRTGAREDSFHEESSR
jgi:hypothetical protein